MTFLVTWPLQQSSGQPPEAYATEALAAQRADDLVARGQAHATYFEIDDEKRPS